MSSRHRLLAALAGLVFLAAHVWTLPRTLEDIDSINFGLGVEKFDVAAHRPHPPGYPVFIALAKASTAAVHALRPGWDRDRSAAVGLAVWGLLAGTLATFVLMEFWLAVGLSPPLALLAALLAVVSPLFWFTAARPLSDTPGLVAAIAVQTWLITGLRVIRASPAAPLPRQWLWGTFAAGLFIGLRSQTLWLAAPLLCWCAGRLLLSRRVADTAKLVGAGAIGVLVWAVPLVWLTGGVRAYVDAVGSQGAQDLTGGAELFANYPTRQMFRLALRHTFVEPWQLPALATTAQALSVLGAAWLAWRRRPLLAAIVVAFGPYLAFHLVFHETVTIRYGLPIIVPMAGLIVVALGVLGTRVAAAGVAVLAATCLIVAQPPLKLYAHEGAPVFRAFQDMQRALPGMAEQPVVRKHHQVYWGLLQVVSWYRPVWDVGVFEHPGKREWLDVVRHFTSGGTRPVWFLGDLARNDLVLIDHRARALRGRYELRPEVRSLIRGSRLDSMNWWSIDRPGWMLGTGWSLTPEIAGMTAADGTGPHQRPAEAFILRGRRPLRLMIGGRNLAGGGPPALVSVELDGQPLAQWTATAASRWFVQWIDLPAGIAEGDSPYARLTVRAASATPGQSAPAVGLEQFDAAPADDVIYAFSDDWHELEEDPAAKGGRLWRWTSDRSTLLVKGGDRDSTLVLAGESPLRNFSAAPVVIVRAGDRELARFQPAADFSQRIALPADAVAAAAGRVTIATSLTFVPGDRGNTGDRRKLGLKLFQVDIERR